MTQKIKATAEDIERLKSEMILSFKEEGVTATEFIKVFDSSKVPRRRAFKEIIGKRLSQGLLFQLAETLSSSQIVTAVKHAFQELLEDEDLASMVARVTPDLTTRWVYCGLVSRSMKARRFGNGVLLINRKKIPDSDRAVVTDKQGYRYKRTIEKESDHPGDYYFERV